MAVGFLISTPIGIGVLSAVAFLLSLVMLYKSLSQAGLPGCGAGSGCDAVARSRWSRWMSIPVAGPGAAVYLTILLCAVLVRLPGAAGIQRLAWSIMPVAGLLAMGAAVWFVSLQIVAVKRMCPYCTALHLCGLAIGALTILRNATASAVPVAAISFSNALTLASVAMAALVAGQVLIEPKLYSVSLVESAPEPTEPLIQSEHADAAHADSASVEVRAAVAEPSSVQPNEHSLAAATAAPARTITVARGKVVLSIADWPIVGLPHAKYVLPKLLDYTCEDCRHMHQLLKEVLPQLGGELAILIVPAPLNPACNPLVSKLDARHAEACELARLALAVWLADASKFQMYHDRLFAPPLPPPAPDARRWAAELVGSETLGQALGDGSIEQHLADAVRMLQAIGGGKLPKLLLPQAVLWGRVPSAQHLLQAIDRHVMSQ